MTDPPFQSSVLAHSSRLATEQSWATPSVYQDRKGCTNRGEPPCTDTTDVQTFQRIDGYKVSPSTRGSVLTLIQSSCYISFLSVA